MYSKTTNSINVSVRPVYLEGQSDPDSHYYVWAYQVRIENMSKRTVQLLSRHWKITDGLGHVQEVQGEGVVGEQPVLRPGQFYEYTSGAPLTTSSGIMVGSYNMQDPENGEGFAIDIPAFSLDVPDARPRMN